MTLGKARYKVDLKDLHAVCEANYARLLQIFPGYETSNSRELLAEEARIRLEVVERSRYTTIFRLYQTHTQRWLGQLQLELRAYHDAQMLEVGSFQNQRAQRAKYSYPNDAMHQQDEKSRQNHFLAEWFDWCITHGRVAQTELPL